MVSEAVFGWCEVRLGDVVKAEEPPVLRLGKPKKPSTQQTLAEVRKTLPVYAYREEIIEAV